VDKALARAQRARKMYQNKVGVNQKHYNDSTVCLSVPLEAQNGRAHSYARYVKKQEVKVI